MTNVKFLELIMRAHGLNPYIETEKGFGFTSYEVFSVDEKGDKTFYAHGVGFEDAVCELMEALHETDFKRGDFLKGAIKVFETNNKL